MSKSIPFLALLLIAGALALTACGSGQSRNQATAKATASVPGDATRAKQELDHVAGALRGLRDASDTADLKRLYGDLKSHTGQLDGALAEVVSSSEAAVAAGQAQIARWREQANTFTDAGLRNASSRRESELRESVDSLAASNAALKTTSTAFSAKLKQTLTALDLDLSQPGVQSIKPVMARLVDEEAPLRQALGDVAAKSRAVHALVNP